ncbi:helix-turn-helix domain-containing protein [Pseudonocardia sp. H11422]|uniref:TetR/AcrR family transcriptional regulator n=1 Tax=Pseudonocardia sp. H11422 TaxID=2835866 RepID=UPI0027E33BB2|nr:helix-turn-helix domain-containing protein [Pseudonocardia sp. H11422]
MLGPTERPAPRVALTPGARKVLDAASKLFYERGIHSVGVDTIAAEAGVTKKTLYDRFGSKDQIVVEYLRARDEHWRAFLDEQLSGSTGADRLLAVFDAAARWEAEHSPRGCSFVNARAEIPDSEHPAFALIDEAKQFMLELFVRLAAEAGAADPADLGATLFVLHEGALVAGGIGTVPDAMARARRAAAALLAGAPAGVETA